MERKWCPSGSLFFAVLIFWIKTTRFFLSLSYDKNLFVIIIGTKIEIVIWATGIEDGGKQIQFLFTSRFLQYALQFPVHFQIFFFSLDSFFDFWTYLKITHLRFYFYRTVIVHYLSVYYNWIVISLLSLLDYLVLLSQL